MLDFEREKHDLLVNVLVARERARVARENLERKKAAIKAEVGPAGWFIIRAINLWSKWRDRNAR